MIHEGESPDFLEKSGFYSKLQVYEVQSQQLLNQ